MLIAARIALVVTGVLLVGLERVLARRGISTSRPVHWGLGLWAGANIAFLAFLFANHVSFPANLDLMEGTVLQHIERAAAFQKIYDEPTPAFVPLAYNPLFYLLTAPLTWVFGSSLTVARFVAILGSLLAITVVGAVVWQRTRSKWWSMIAVGLFAAAYRVTDAYLDTAHSDSWLLASTLLGCWVLDRRRSPRGILVGMSLLVAAFWFKQHGALFVAGALAYLTLRDGIRRAWMAWLIAVIGGPFLYLFLGPTLFGPTFHHFTWEVPRQWSSLDGETVKRFAGFAWRYYPLLALFALISLRSLRFRSPSLDVWRVMYPFTLLSGFMGSLDAGSSDNVFIPMTIWTLLLGTLELQRWQQDSEIVRRWGVSLIALFISFALLSYPPRTVISSSEARESYRDLVGFLHELEASVYAPSLGQLQRGFELHPAAHWVALEDMIRGPGKDTRNHPNTRRLLAPALKPEGPAYVLSNLPLSTYPWIAFLEDSYELEADLGDRFEPLRVMPARWDHGWPRYLYRYRGTE